MGLGAGVDGRGGFCGGVWSSGGRVLLVSTEQQLFGIGRGTILE